MHKIGIFNNWKTKKLDGLEIKIDKKTHKWTNFTNENLKIGTFFQNKISKIFKIISQCLLAHAPQKRSSNARRNELV